MVFNPSLVSTVLDAWVNLVRLLGTIIKFETLLTQHNQIGQDTPRRLMSPFSRKASPHRFQYVSQPSVDLS